MSSIVLIFLSLRVNPEDIDDVESNPSGYEADDERDDSGKAILY